MCICVFACPEQSSQCLFLTCNYFCPCPVLSVVSFFRWLTGTIFSTPERAGVVPGARGGWLAQLWQTKGFVLLAPSRSSAARHHIRRKKRSIFNLSYSGNQRGRIKTRAVTDSRRRSLSYSIWYNEHDNQSKVRNPPYLFSEDFCDVSSQGIIIIEHVCDNDLKNSFPFYLRIIYI